MPLAYYITDRQSCSLPILQQIQQAIDASVDLIQIREKDLATRPLLELASRALELAKGSRSKILINDRVDIALAGKASGVHLGQEDMPLFYARALLGHSRLIGISVSTIVEAHRAEQEGADYIGVGPVFPTSTKDCGRPPLGLDGLRKIRQAVGIPILAIGGVNAANARETMDAGADGLAVISAIMKASDVGLAVTELLAAIAAKK